MARSSPPDDIALETGRAGLEGPDTVEVLKRNRGWTLVAFSPLVAMMVALVAAMPLLERGRLEVVMGMWAVAVVGSIAAASWLDRVRRRDPQPRRLRQPLSLDERTIRIGERAIPRASIAHAAYAPSPHPHVRLTLGGVFPEHVRLGVAHAGEGRALIEALELDEGHTSATFVAAPPLAGSWGRALGFIGVMLGAVGLASLGGPIPMLLVAMVIAVGLGAPQRVEVGVDGLHTRWLGRQRFVPWDQVEDVRVDSGMGHTMNLVVEVHDASPLTIVLQQSTDAPSPAQALRDRIERARARHDAGEVFDEGMLARPQGLAPVDWLAHLRALRELTAHRRPAVDADRLWRLVETPRVAPRLRIAAAVALGEDARGPAAKQRIGEVARRAAQPSLRLALEACEAQNDDALLEALVALEEPPAPRKAQ